ncbi:MAG: hypothetical protein HY737_05855 [Candidatus Omnitrophica bacterium]|nr:hypothetical protein [Candidatus Omnitrophota bacterium]
MRAITFPYGLYRGLPSPLIPVQFRGPRDWKEVWVYVDSGAFLSILAEAEARLLGLTLEEGKLTYSIVGDGSLIPVYIHELSIRIGPSEVRARIGFSPRLGVGFNLLGRQDIFTAFDVTFSDFRRQVIFAPVGKKSHSSGA